MRRLRDYARRHPTGVGAPSAQGYLFRRCGIGFADLATKRGVGNGRQSTWRWGENNVIDCLHRPNLPDRRNDESLLHGRELGARDEDGARWDERHYSPPGQRVEDPEIQRGRDESVIAVQSEENSEVRPLQDSPVSSYEQRLVSPALNGLSVGEDVGGIAKCLEAVEDQR